MSVRYHILHRVLLFCFSEHVWQTELPPAHRTRVLLSVIDCSRLDGNSSTRWGSGWQRTITHALHYSETDAPERFRRGCVLVSALTFVTTKICHTWKWLGHDRIIAAYPLIHLARKAFNRTMQTVRVIGKIYGKYGQF
jgi:hypothetical protein